MAAMAGALHASKHASNDIRRRPDQIGSLTGALSQTVLAPLPASGPSQRMQGAAGSRRSRLGWLAGSVGYIYVYLREKVDAGERRRRLTTERDGAERLLAGALTELGINILREGIQHPDLTGLLEAIGRAEARRETATADIAASEKLLSAEEGRLGAQELVLESEWTICDKASREAEEVLRGVSKENQETASRLARTRDARARLERDAEAAESAPDGKQRAAHLRHEAAGKRSEESALEAQVARLDQQLVEMRERSSSLRASAQATRTKLEAAVTTRRSAGSAMKASIAAHTRGRADAEREVADLTEQLGRAAAQARPPGSTLAPLYQGIDRLQETLADRGRQTAALDQAQYDRKKLLAGVGLLTSLFAVTAAVLWVVLRK
jgi:chromosome segregation ATPase